MSTLTAPGIDPKTLPPGATGPVAVTPMTPEQTAAASNLDANGNPRVQGEFKTDPATGINSFVPINRSVDPATDPATFYLDTFKAPETAAQIAERKRKDAQALIDSTNTLYDTQVADEKQQGQQRLNKNNSINVLSGLMGSTEAVRTDNEVSSANQKAVDAVNAKRAVALQSIYSQISKDADIEAEQQKQDATKSAEDILARRKQTQTDAITNLTAMAKSGAVDFDAFKNSPQNAKVYQYALDAVGGSEDALKGLFAANRPQDQLVGSPVRVGDHFVQAYKNPLTGKVSYDTIAIPGGVPTEYTQFQRIGKDNNTLIAIPDNWDGDVSKIKTIYSGAAPGSGDGSGTAAGYNGDFAATIANAARNFTSVAGQKQAVQDLQSTIAAGDYKSAYQTIIQSAGQGLTAENRTKFQNAAIDSSLMTSLKTKLQALADSGYNTSLLTGTADDIQKKLGVLKTDPKYAATAVELDRVFQQYRQNMTGAAFGAAESSEYAKVLPSKSNTLSLNLALINGALGYNNDFVEGVIKNSVGEGGVYIKQYAEGAKPAASGGGDLKSQAAAQGYDYDAMKADGHSDEEIRAALGL